MPKVVNHERRREELADTALGLIAREGIRGVTTRAVAEESGWSTGVLSHYFGSRSDLLLAALRRAAELQGRILREYRSQAGESAIERLELIVESVLPLDSRRLALTRIFLVFYSETGVNSDAREEVTDYLDNWRRLARRTIMTAQEEGSIPSTLDPQRLATDLLAHADGLAVHASIDPHVLADLMANPRATRRILEQLINPSPAPEPIAVVSVTH